MSEQSGGTPAWFSVLLVLLLGCIVVAVDARLDRLEDEHGSREITCGFTCPEEPAP